MGSIHVLSHNARVFDNGQYRNSNQRAVPRLNPLPRISHYILLYLPACSFGPITSLKGYARLKLLVSRWAVAYGSEWCETVIAQPYRAYRIRAARAL
jgi:hypothetical protein